MSIRVMTQVWDTSEQKGSALLLLLALADHAADDGFCWPGLERLAKKIRMSTRSVMRKLQELEESTELAVVRRLGQHNWYVVRIGMSDEQVKGIFAARSLEWAPDLAQGPEEKQGVYVLEGNGYYKIGHSANLELRISQLNAQLPFPVKTICVIQCNDYIELERGLHERFADVRANGEWFRLKKYHLVYLKRLEKELAGALVTSDTQAPTSDTAMPKPVTQLCPPNLHEPSLNRQEEPATPDSPPIEDSHPDPSELCRPGLPGLLPVIDAPQPTVEELDILSDIHLASPPPIRTIPVVLTIKKAAAPPQDPMFWPEGETPPKPSPHEPVEQGKARRCRELGTDPLQVAAVVAQNRAGVEHPDGGDASRDGDPWADKPLRAFCALVGQDIEHLKESKRKDWPRELSKWAQTYGHTVAPQEAFECIRGITQSEFNWMTFTSPRQTTFQEALDAMVNRFRGGKPWDAGINGKRNGASGGRGQNEYAPTDDQKRRYKEALGSRLVSA